MEEVAKLTRVIAQYGEKSEKPGEQTGSLSDEIADLIFVLVCIANQTGVDVETTFKENLDKKTQHDSIRHKNNSKL